MLPCRMSEAVLPASTVASSIAPEVFEAILEAALKAPSGDNTQPWQFVPRPFGFEVRFVPERAAALLDVSSLASRMSLGALLENARIAGRAQGAMCHWQLDPDPADPLLWARVTLTASDPVQEELSEAIEHRHTNRKVFDKKPLGDDVIRALSSEGAAPVGLHWLTERKPIHDLARLVARADAIRAESRIAHDDLYRWLRWTPEEAERTRDGLDVRTLELAPHERLALPVMKSWALTRVANAFGGAAASASYGKRLALGSGAVGLLTVPAVTPALAVEAGHVMERVWLRATQRGLGFSPMAPLVLLTLRVDLLGGEALSSRHIARLSELRTALRALFGLANDEHALFCFRIGHSEPAQVRALRRRLSDTLTQ